MDLSKHDSHKKPRETATTSSSNSSEGERGGLFVAEPPTFKVPLLCDSLPDVSGDNSCDYGQNKRSYVASLTDDCLRKWVDVSDLTDCDIIRSRTSCEVADELNERH